MSALLELDQLSIAFQNRNAVNELTLRIEPGESLGLVGESGSGKSVTALAILRLLDPAARMHGSIRFAGRDLLSLSSDEMRKIRGREISMIFQEPMTALNPVMPIGEQIAEAIRTHQPERSRREVRDAVIEAMTAVALPEPERRLGDYPHQFSGGQRQRILIAMAIVNRPRLLIADEPTTALDVTVQAQILDLLADLRERYSLAMLFISHDLAVVSQVADRVAVMRHGLLLEEGPKTAIFQSPQHAYTRSLLGAIPTLRTDKDRPLATLAGAAQTDGGEWRQYADGHWVRG
ncbi:ABC transporter ATP-binding protein [Acidobacterium sp. S8]|uniref:ABC transporter ATP-binding protein n=1 Tax=Acidobacterium sp. S8 TaxID=1641854 RepID=UPI00131D7FDE|nr:ABC transporter ATP-binding protein [Acidobacterium sp. S8]